MRYKIDNGVLLELTEEETKRIEKDAYRYALKCVTSDVVVYDFDKDRVRPYVKDYLNRRWASLESKLLTASTVMALVAMIFAFYAGIKADTNAKAVSALVKAQQTQTENLNFIRNNAK